MRWWWRGWRMRVMLLGAMNFVANGSIGRDETHDAALVEEDEMLLLAWVILVTLFDSVDHFLFSVAAVETLHFSRGWTTDPFNLQSILCKHGQRAFLSLSGGIAQLKDRKEKQFPVWCQKMQMLHVHLKTSRLLGQWYNRASPQDSWEWCWTHCVCQHCQYILTIGSWLQMDPWGWTRH